MSGIRYRPEIDGLRALAVIPVILFHMGVDWIPGGFLGVDVFFVISGFLITSILMSELDQGTFAFKTFWARRVRRILPALAVVTAATLLCCQMITCPTDHPLIGRQALAGLFSLANLFFWHRHCDYWSRAAESLPFLHTWTLSVEEQFYLLFPVVLWLLFRWRARWLSIGLGSIVVGSLGIFWYGLEAFPTANFYLLPSRAWELGAGCLLADLMHRRAKRADQIRQPLSLRGSILGARGSILGAIGLLLVGGSYLWIQEPNGWMPVAVGGTALIIGFGQSGWCHKLLSHQLLVHLGKLSYSLYLWHWPVLTFARDLNFTSHNVANMTILFGLMYALSWVSYNFVEQPFRRREGIIPPLLTGSSMVAVAAILIVFVPRFYDTSNYDSVRWYEYDCRPNWTASRHPLFHNVVIENPGFAEDTFESGQGIRVARYSETPEIVVFGDSHGNMWSDAIASIAKDLDIPTAFMVIGRGESPFFEIPPRQVGRTNALTAEQKFTFDKNRLQAIESWKPKLIVIAARWRAEHLQTANDLLEFVSDRNITVLLIEDPPELQTHDRNTMQFLAWQGLLRDNPPSDLELHLPCKTLAENEGARGVVRYLSDKFSNVKYLPTYDLYAVGNQVKVLSGRTPLYLDDDHLSAQGARLVVPRMHDAISQILSLDSHSKEYLTSLHDR